MFKRKSVLFSLALIALLVVAAGTLYAQSTFQGPRVYGRFIAAGSGTAPVLSSCGTATISGNDTAGAVTQSTGGAACTLTFNEAFATAPVCYFNDRTTAGKTNAGTTYKVVESTTAVTVTFQATPANGDVIAYFCMGR